MRKKRSRGGVLDRRRVVGNGEGVRTLNVPKLAARRFIESASQSPRLPYR